MASSPSSQSSTGTTAHVTPAASLRPSPLWRNVSFSLMWASVAASGFGDRMIQLAAWPLLGINEPDAQAASIQAAVLFFFFLPYVFFGPVGGWLADTLPRKWIMFTCDEMRAVVLLGAVIMLTIFAPQYAGESIARDHPMAGLATYGTYGVILLTGLFAAFFSPTRDAMVPQIVPMHQLQGANALILAIATIASLIGLGVGGWLIEAYSVRLAVTTGFLCFLISGTFWIFLKPREHRRTPIRPKQSEWRRLVAATTYVARHRRIGILVMLALLFWGLANIALASIAALCKQQYGVQENLVSAIANMQLTIGVGMLVSSLLLMAFTTLRESHLILYAGILGAGAGLFGLWISTSYTVGLMLAFSLGFFSNFMRVCTDTLTQALSPNYIRGRVFGMREILTSGAVVVVNLVIWQIPNADDGMIRILPVLGISLLLLGLVGIWYGLSRGPTDQWMANLFWRLNRLYCFTWHHLRIAGKHHVPQTGPVILAANHTAGLDPLLIQAAVPRVIRWVMLESYMFRWASPLWKTIRPIALEKGGRDTARVRTLVESVKQGDAVGIFPEGGLQGLDRELRPLQPGIGMIARRSNAPIVPVWIAGTPRTRRMLWFFLRPSRSRILFGEAFTPGEELDAREITEMLHGRLLELQKQAEAAMADSGDSTDASVATPA